MDLKKIVYINSAIIIMIIAFIAFFHTAGKPKAIAYINSVRLFNEYEGMKVAKKEYDTKSQLYKTRLDSLSLAMNKKLSEFETTRKDLSAEQINQKMRKLEEEKVKLNQYADKLMNSLKQEEQDITRKAFEPVDVLIKEYGKKHNYTMILSASTSGNIVYAADGIDITEEILELINNEYRKVRN